MSYFVERRAELLDEVPLTDWQGSTIRRLVVAPKDRQRKPRRDCLLVQLHAATLKQADEFRAGAEAAARRLEKNFAQWPIRQPIPTR